MASQNEVAQYYDSTFDHYRKWWKLSTDLSLHYGIWEEGINSFSESLSHTNQIMLTLANISKSDIVLDAGCGVGGAAFQINKVTGARVVGINVSRKQIEMANQIAHTRDLHEMVTFQYMDLTETNFDSGSFDVVWACESVCHADNKSNFLREAFRLLKKNGRLILSDFFLSGEKLHDPGDWIRKWGERWSFSELDSSNRFKERCTQAGFRRLDSFDYTDKITKSARRLYHASLLGAIPSELYNLLHPGVSKYARKHYKSGIYQYKALKKGLWKYFIIRAFK